MKKLLLFSLVLALTLTLGFGVALADKPADGTTGNGSPKAKLLGKLNIIGVSNPKNANMHDDGGSVIFVDLYGHNKIGLVESGTEEAPGTDLDDFAVLDKNATDNDGALFALPDPDLDPYNTSDPAGADTTSAYSVFLRPLGPPGGWATITTCAELLDSNFGGLLSGKFLATLNKAGYFGGYASVEQVGQDILERKAGKSTFQNVTAELLTIVFMVSVELEGGAIITEYIRVPIFDSIIQGEYWDYDNRGLKLCQVRFYNISTDVALSDGNWNNLP